MNLHSFRYCSNKFVICRLRGSYFLPTNRFPFCRFRSNYLDSTVSSPVTCDRPLCVLFWESPWSHVSGVWPFFTGTYLNKRIMVMVTCMSACYLPKTICVEFRWNLLLEGAKRIREFFLSFMSFQYNPHILRDDQLKLFYQIYQKPLAVAYLVEALCYKLEGREFESRWGHWMFKLI
jgi:hypothetical protein